MAGGDGGAISNVATPCFDVMRINLPDGRDIGLRDVANADRKGLGWEHGYRRWKEQCQCRSAFYAIAYNVNMAFKVFDLQCESAHVFEGWFASHADYDSQLERGLLVCPVCNSTNITRRLSAPRLNVSGATDPALTRPARGASDGDEASRIQAQLIRQVRASLRAAENVGPRFAEEARRIHEGEAPERAIRGTATTAESEALADDGIAVMPVPAIFDDERLQ